MSEEKGTRKENLLFNIKFLRYKRDYFLKKFYRLIMKLTVIDKTYKNRIDNKLMKKVKKWRDKKEAIKSYKKLSKRFFIGKNII
jgi:hypothetical protein